MSFTGLNLRRYCVDRSAFRYFLLFLLLFPQFGRKAMRHRRRGGHNELLGKAVGVGRKPSLYIIDATAGLGRDAFVLADLGCRVALREREPILVAMLQSALQRAQSSADDWIAQVTARMHLLPSLTS